MPHLIFDSRDGRWYEATPAWSDTPVVSDEPVEPQVGDTFTDFTTKSTKAIPDLRKRDLGVEILRTAMWGENDYRIIDSPLARRKQSTLQE